MHHKRALLMLTALVSACGTPTQMTPDLGSGDVDVQIAQATCERDARCGNIGDAEVSACKQAALDATTRFPPAYSYDEAIAQGRLTVDEAARAECLRLSGSAPCTVDGIFQMLEACDAVYVPKVSDGGACKANFECVRGQCDQSTYGCAGTCRAYLATGAACDTNDSRCSLDDFCSSETGKCTTRAALSAPCGDTVRCDLSYSCVGVDPQTGTGGTCLGGSPVGAGCETFFFGNSNCDPALYCDTTTRTCTARVALDASCNGFYACADGLLCIGLTFDEDGNVAARGTCRAPLALGAACDPAFAETGCPLSMRCDVDSRSCVAFGALGADCSELSCAAGFYCDGAQMRCAAVVPFGGACTPSGEGGDDPCQDGTCDLDSGTCALICQ